MRHNLKPKENEEQSPEPFAFVIMKIGDAELDYLYQDHIKPAVESCGLTAKRVDQDNLGYLLKSEIVNFIEGAQIIIADLTHERPNCYLEVGIAMGKEKYSTLVLTVREDHHQSSLNYKQKGPKVHFDAAGYDILFWESDKLPEFRTSLENRIKKRLAALALTRQSTAGNLSASPNWFGFPQKK